MSKLYQKINGSAVPLSGCVGVINNLNSESTTDALSVAQGKSLNDSKANNDVISSAYDSNETYSKDGGTYPIYCIDENELYKCTVATATGLKPSTHSAQFEKVNVADEIGALKVKSITASVTTETNQYVQPYGAYKQVSFTSMGIPTDATVISLEARSGTSNVAYARKSQDGFSANVTSMVAETLTIEVFYIN